MATGILAITPMKNRGWKRKHVVGNDWGGKGNMWLKMIGVEKETCGWKLLGWKRKHVVGNDMWLRKETCGWK